MVTETSCWPWHSVRTSDVSHVLRRYPEALQRKAIMRHRVHHVTPDEYKPLAGPRPSSPDYSRGWRVGVQDRDTGEAPSFLFENVPMYGSFRHGYQDGYKHAGERS